ncbi:MAG: F0F1 ATP synthase subunit alpha [Chloroflexi bacterium]|nr:MAG: F0F1 ATP synthase subunit alpha [Chloroflexota bacterium]
MATVQQEVQQFFSDTFDIVERVRQTFVPRLTVQEFGTVTFVGEGIARVVGLPNVQLEEVVRFANGVQGQVFNLDADEVGIILLGHAAGLRAGDQVMRTGRVQDIAVGPALLGRVISATGAPLDGLPAPHLHERTPVERPAPPIMQRAPVTVPLQTGIKVIDALLPIGRGQRELILGDRQTGKSAIALDTIINQRDQDVICVYCSVGQRSAAVARLIADLRRHDALGYTVVVVAGGDDPPGLQFIAPYAATTIGEYFMLQGRDVLIVYDDLTHHARAYRELSLLLRRPPGREAYPGDIFYIHSRLLERSTHLKSEYGGGSLTALPIVETQGQDMSAYIPTNLISITDGQIYLSPALFHRSIIPAVDVGRSVSRVGGKAQLPAYHAVAGPLRLAYSQFEELEIFSRFSTRLDEQTRKTLERGRHVRELLKQPQYHPIPVPEQIAVLLAAAAGLFDPLPLDEVRRAEQAVRETVKTQLPDLYRHILAGKPLSPEDRQSLLDTARSALARAHAPGYVA